MYASASARSALSRHVRGVGVHANSGLMLAKGPFVSVHQARTFTSRYGHRERLPLNFGFVIVPQQKAYVVERLGKFSQTLGAGWYFLIPVIDKISYVHSLKEEAIAIPNQTAITRDNVTITIDGVLYIRINDPHAASYGVSDPIFALTQLAQTTMRSELGKITLDKTFEERETLNSNIVTAINQAAKAWGTECLRYEIKDIVPPPSVKTAMDSQAEAERKKRADILASEGYREAEINRAEGARQSLMLQAQGEAEAILARARASASAVEMLASSTRKKGGREAVAMRVAEQYVNAFGKIAKRGNTMVIPADAGNVASMVAQALGVFNSLSASNMAASAAGIPYHRGAAAAEEENDDEELDEPEPTGISSQSASTLPSGSDHAAGGDNGSGKGFVPEPYPSSPPAKAYHAGGGGSGGTMQ